MSARPIRLIVPEVGTPELEEIRTVLESGHLTQGRAVSDFEAAIGTITRARHAIATTSATTALHLSLAALDVGPGDEVIVPDFTFPATSNVVVALGARPILVDVDLDGYCVTLEAVEAALSPRTRAVMPVHAFGLAAPVPQIVRALAPLGVRVIEDAACALGTTLDGVSVGTFDLAGCFSFHPRKAITTGEGGMVVTDDDQFAERLRALRTHGGRRVGGRFVFDETGFNYRMSDILAAVGIAQTRRLASIVARRRDLARWYDQQLSDIDGIHCPRRTPGHVYQSYVVLLESDIDRDRVITFMAERGIETTLGTYAVHAQPAMRRFGYSPGDLPNSYRAFKSTLTLPLHGAMTEEDLERTVSALRDAIGH
jgi:perosamine synthetase